MPLLGSAAMLLSFDVVADAIAEHDRWHTRSSALGRESTHGGARSGFLEFGRRLSRAP